ncbi:MAG TPA: c-type cytochrome [Gammaproteobacteria bacterium]|nr:c-type cytochrome [Gammaproteobacteria bacterium]
MSRVVLTVLAILIAVTVDVEIAAQTLDQDHGQYSRADVEAGQRLYGPQCQVCHGANGDGVPGIDLKLGRFRRASSDDDLARTITSGVPGTGMPAFVLRPEELVAIVAFIRAGFDPASASVRVGDAARGRALFQGKAGCAECHRVNGLGPRVAPDLSDIGAIRTLAALQRALLAPGESLLPIHRAVTVVTRDGRTLHGRRLNEDTYTVQIIDEQENLLSLEKASLRELAVDTVPKMPSYADRLTADDLADVIAYLVSLKGL